MAAKINIDDLSLAVIKELNDYARVTDEAVKEAVNSVAKDTAQMIRQNAEEAYPTGQGRSTGEYAKSWSYKRDPNLKGRWAHSMVVYAKDPYYRLTHLLEKGHAKINGGRVIGRPHIAPAEEFARRALEQRIRQNMSKEG